MGKTYIRYNNEDVSIRLGAFSVSSSIISLMYPNVRENLNGFVIYDEEGGVVADGSDFKYRWDVLEGDPDRIYYTNSPDNVQTKKLDMEDQIEEVDPLTNEELTEAVADLMYEVSVAKLGL